MRRRHRTTVLLAGTVAMVAVGGGISAWANWVTDAAPAAAHGTVGQVPKAGQPRAEVSEGSPKIVWDAPVTAPGWVFDGFTLIRRNGNLSTPVCTVPAKTTTCRDRTAPSGAKVTYVVRATFGTSWTGPDSEPSSPVQVPTSPVARLAANLTDPATGAVAPAPVAVAPTSPDVPVVRSPDVQQPVERATTAPATAAGTKPATTAPAVPDPVPPVSSPSTAAPSAAGSSSAGVLE